MPDCIPDEHHGIVNLVYYAKSLAHVNPVNVQQLDSVELIGDLQKVGKFVAEKVKPEHFAGFRGEGRSI